jgi:hypothetical protein
MPYDDELKSVEWLEQQLVGLLGRFAEALPAAELQDMKDLVSAGERGIEFENLCTQLVEYDVGVDAADLESLAEMGGKMSINPKYWERLRLGG